MKRLRGIWVQRRGRASGTLFCLLSDLRLSASRCLGSLSWDEIARTSQAIGDQNTLPLELQGLTTSVTTPVIYALGTMTTLLSLTVMGACLLAVRGLGRRRVT